ncbi:MAG: PfkB family carbohydrate kinase [Pseudomonadota bacterium]
MTGRIICIGHAALDRVFRVNTLPRGPTKIRALEYIESGGGIAANAAVAISRLGGKVELWSRVGDDDVGARIRAGLVAEGVDTRYVASFEEARSSTSAVIVDDAGDRVVVGARDVQMPSSTSWLPLERVKEAQAVLADLRWLESVRAVFGAARSAGVPTILDIDLGGREALPDLLSLTDYAIFTEPALEDFLPNLDLKSGLDRAMLHGVRHAGVTRGARGYVWRDSFGGGEIPAYAVDAVDTTGAGDAFHGAFALALSERRAAVDCARFAAAVAALKCMRLGSRAGLPRRTDVEAFLSRGATPGAG